MRRTCFWNCKGTDVDNEVVPVVYKDVVSKALLEVKPEFHGHVAVQGVASDKKNEEDATNLVFRID